VEFRWGTVFALGGKGYSLEGSGGGTEQGREGRGGGGGLFSNAKKGEYIFGNGEIESQGFMI